MIIKLIEINFKNDFYLKVHSSISQEARFIVEHLIMMYKASNPNNFYIFSADKCESTLNTLYFNPFSLLTPNKIKKAKFFFTLDEPQMFNVKLNGIKNSIQYNCSIAKTISDSGGISIFQFLFMYLVGRSENQIVLNKSMNLILFVYNSHYYHRLMFDKHYGGYELLLYVLERSRKSFSGNLMKTFSQFVIHTEENYPIILSTNIETFFYSWKIWHKNLSTTKQFFQLLNSLVIMSNPYRNFNLALLKKIGAFSHLIYMIQDMHYFEQNALDGESLNYFVTLIQTMIENFSNFELVKIIFHCLLFLQNSEWLHVNQTKASFYYLFPSNWLINKEENNLPSVNIHSVKINEVRNDKDMIDDDFNLDDWEIVTEMFKNSSPVSLVNEKPTSATTITANATSNINSSNKKLKNNSELVSCELILLINKYLDQISDVYILNSIFEDVSCLDFLIILINNPSDKVRETALMTFFKLYRLQFDDYCKESMNDVKTLKGKTLSLLMLSNQLNNYMATEKMISICLSFLFNLNEKKADDLLNLNYDQYYLKKIIVNVSLSNFIPLLAILPKCISSVSFCYKVLQLFHKIINKMSMHQINELLTDYGLIQSLSKLIINLNTQLSILAEDMHKYSKEQLNEQINQIFYCISFNYILNNDSNYYLNYLNFIDYYSIIERKVDAHLSELFRQVQVAIFQASFEALDKLQTTVDKNYPNYGYRKNSLKKIVINFVFFSIRFRLF